MVVFCPGCGAKISVQPETPGGDVQCPRCHSTFPTAGVKSATDVPPPKRFRPKKAGRSKFAVASIVSFTADTPDAVYSVAYEDFDRPEAAEQFVAKQRADLTAGKGGKLVGEKDVTAGPHKGKEFVVEVPGRGTAHIRFVPAGRRLYKVTALGTGKPPDAGEVAKLFESFQITG